MKPYHSETFEALGPNGEPLTVIAALHCDEDSRPEFYGELVSWRDVRGPCVHLDSGTVIFGNVRRWEYLLSDLETTRDECREFAARCRCEFDEYCEFCTGLADKWCELRDYYDELRVEGYNESDYDAVKHHTNDGGREYRWANLNTEGNYNGVTTEELRTYCEQDAARLRDWARDYWHYCGLMVKVLYQGEVIAESSCWGLEDDDKELVNLPAHEITREALHDAHRELTERARAAASDIVTV